jgi:hypothetical protein
MLPRYFRIVAAVILLASSISAPAAAQSTFVDPPIALPAAQLISIASWTECGGPSASGDTISISITDLAKIADCTSAKNYSSTITGLSQLTFREMTSAEGDRHTPRLALLEEDIAGRRGHRFEAMQSGLKAIRAMRRNNYSDNELEDISYWMMLSSDMKTVLEDHGGTLQSNFQDRPQEWKQAENDDDLWVYRSSGNVTIYRFSRIGKLLKTTKT